jgi:hypothetical protein
MRSVKSHTVGLTAVDTFTGATSLKVSILFIFFLFFSASHAQTIRSGINKNRILLGEQAELVVETEASSPLYLNIDTIPHFELIGFPKIDTIKKENTVQVRGIYTITSFDSGRWMIPAFSISRNVSSDSIPVEVVFSDFDPKQDYHDIKDIIETKEEVKKFPWWWIALGVLLLAIIIYFIIKRKPVKQTSPGRSLLTAYQEAMQKLEQLGRSKPASKEYYSSLTDIFRIYISKARGIRSLQKTTHDLVVQVSMIGLPKSLFDELAQVLRLSDFVKFAKYQPLEEDDRNAINVIRTAIDQIEKMRTNTGEEAKGQS